MTKRLRSVSVLKQGHNTVTIGTRIRFIGPDARLVSDTVREIFWQQTTTEKGIALILTSHSWIWAKDVTDIEP